MGQRAKIAMLRIIYKLYSLVEKEKEKYAAACNETLRSYNTLILGVHGTWDSGREGGGGREGCKSTIKLRTSVSAASSLRV